MNDVKPIGPNTPPSDFQTNLAKLSNKGSSFGRNYLILDSKGQLEQASFGKYLLQVCKQFFQGKNHAESIKTAATEFLKEGLGSLDGNLFEKNFKELNTNIKKLAKRVNIDDKSRNSMLNDKLRTVRPILTSQNPILTSQNQNMSQPVQDVKQARKLISQIMQGIPNVSCTIIQSPDIQSPEKKFQIKFTANSEDDIWKIVCRCGELIRANGLKRVEIADWQREGKSDNLYPFTLSSNQSYYFFNFSRVFENQQTKNADVNKKFEEFMTDLQNNLLNEPLKTEALDNGEEVKEWPKLNKTNEEILETLNP